MGAVECAEWLHGDSEALRSGRPRVRAGVASDRAVSLGVAVPKDPEWARRWEAKGIPVLRRSTGGSGLLHEPGDLLWSVVLPRAGFAAAGGPVRSYGRLGAPIATALTEAGVLADWVDPFDLSDRFCLFGPRGQVLASAGRALGGAAQHVSRGSVLHHGTVCGRVDRSALAELFEVPPRLLNDRLAGLDELREGLSTEALGRRMLAQAALAADP